MADDNLVNQRVAIKQFERLGFALTVVDDGKQALDATTRDHFDIVFMDAHFMPEMDGFEATRSIRRYGSRARWAPNDRGEMTADAMQHDRDPCFAAGMDDYLSKPVQLDDLRGVLEKYCGHASERV